MPGMFKAATFLLIYVKCRDKNKITERLTKVFVLIGPKDTMDTCTVTSVAGPENIKINEAMQVHSTNLDARVGINDFH